MNAYQTEIRTRVAVLLSRAICLYQVTRNADGKVDPVSSLSRHILEGIGELKRWTDYVTINGPDTDATTDGDVFAEFIQEAGRDERVNTDERNKI